WHTFFLDEVEDVFQNDDGVIDDDADAQHQRQHGDVVERQVEVEHQRIGRDDRRRDGDARDQRRAEVADEDQYDQRRKQRPQNQVLLNRFERTLDEDRLIAHHLDAEVRRQAALNLAQALLNGINDFDGVGARLLAHLEHDSLLAVQSRDGAGFLDAVFNVTDVTHANRRGAEVGDNQVVEIFDALDASQRAQSQFLRA